MTFLSENPDHLKAIHPEYVQFALPYLFERDFSPNPFSSEGERAKQKDYALQIGKKIGIDFKQVQSRINALDKNPREYSLRYSK